MAFDPVSAVLDIGGKLIDRLWPDPAQAAAAKLELIKLERAGELQVIMGQLAINQVEAASPSIFVSGWRPWIGWVCGMAFAWNWIGLPIALFGAKLAGVEVEMAPASLTEMMPVLLGMLGLSGLRTREKEKGVARR